VSNARRSEQQRIPLRDVLLFWREIGIDLASYVVAAYDSLEATMGPMCRSGGVASRGTTFAAPDPV
jgi:hypothetical protein